MASHCAPGPHLGTVQPTGACECDGRRVMSAHGTVEQVEQPHAQRTRLEKPGEASRTRARCTHQHPTLCSAVPLGEGGWFVGAVRCWAVEHLTRRTRLYKRRLSPSSPFLTVCQRNISNAQLMNKATTISGVARVYLASDTNAPHQLGAACASHGRDSLPTFIGLKGRTGRWLAAHWPQHFD